MTESHKEQIEQKELYLRREWVLWFDTPNLHNSYEETIHPLLWKQNINKVYTIDSIQNFWKLYNNITEPEDLWYKSAYYLFVSNTDPHCLDLNNQNGVTIHFTIFNKTNLNTAWLYTILPFMGESIKYSEYVNGISIKKHKNYYELVLWLKINDEEINDFFIKNFTETYAKKEIELYKHYILTTDQKISDSV